MHAIAVVARDGKKHLEAKDETFRDAGKSGLWTKADARTHTDDLEVKAVRKDVNGKDKKWSGSTGTCP